MIVLLPSRSLGIAALAVGLALAGCSSDKDVPPTTVSSASAGTQANTDTGSGGTFPDVNTTPTQRPTSTIQDLQQAPEGLSGAQSGTQYGESLVGGASGSAPRPAPPPPPEPAADLPQIPEYQSETTTSAFPTEPDTAVAEAPVEPTVEETAPIEEPVVEEPVVEEPVVEEPVVEEPVQTAEATPTEPAPVEVAPIAQPVPPVGTPQPGSQPFSPEAQLALAPGSVPTQGYGAVAPVQAAPTAYGPNYAALAPEAYPVQFPSPQLPPYQPYDPAQAMYRSPYANPPTNYGGAVVSAQPMVTPPFTSPSFTSYAPGYYGGYYGGQPVGMIYFRDGSSRLSSDDRKVLKQIAEMQQAYGGVVRVVGHASMRTSTMDYARHQQANQRISEARANAVKRQLMRYGVPEAAIVATAVSDSRPLYAEVMPNGEAANRRAEVYLSAY